MALTKNSFRQNDDEDDENLAIIVDKMTTLAKVGSYATKTITKIKQVTKTLDSIGLFRRFILLRRITFAIVSGLLKHFGACVGLPLHRRRRR